MTTFILFDDYTEKYSSCYSASHTDISHLQEMFASDHVIEDDTIIVRIESVDCECGAECVCCECECDKTLVYQRQCCYCCERDCAECENRERCFRRRETTHNDY
jgi:hypothetical protein